MNYNFGLSPIPEIRWHCAGKALFAGTLLRAHDDCPGSSRLRTSRAMAWYPFPKLMVFEKGNVLNTIIFLLEIEALIGYLFTRWVHVFCNCIIMHNYIPQLIRSTRERIDRYLCECKVLQSVLPINWTWLKLEVGNQKPARHIFEHFLHPFSAFSVASMLHSSMGNTPMENSW